MDRNGRQKVSGQWVKDVKCMRCKRVTFISAARWNSIPELSMEELRAYGFDPVADLVGALGVDRESAARRDTKKAAHQAEDLFRAGYRGADEIWPETREGDAFRQEQDALSRGATQGELAGEQEELSGEPPA